jgi:dihydroxy-acid dehydratase
MIALARMNVPGIFVYGGTIKPGTWKGQTLTIVSPFEAVGAFSAGKMNEEDFVGIEKNACPSVGACGGMYTANTMSSSFEALGMSLLGSSQMAAPDPEKADSAAQSALVLVEAVRNDLKPRQIITRKSIENAIALVMATGGSTNAVLHYLAIAHAAGVKWTIDDFERMRRKVPGALRPEAFGSLRRRRPASRRRRAASAQGAAEERRPPRRLHHDHRQDARAGS